MSEILQQLPPDLPQADVKRLLNVMQETQADFINLSKYHTIVRLFAKGSEKIGRPKKQTILRPLVTLLTKLYAI